MTHDHARTAKHTDHPSQRYGGLLEPHRSEAAEAEGFEPPVPLGALAFKSWADRVPQCAPGVLPRKIVRGDLEPSAIVFGSLLHRCYMVAAFADRLGVKAATSRYAVRLSSGRSDSSIVNVGSQNRRDH